MAAPQPLSFAAQLKRLRRAANVSQEELGRRAGFSVSYISQLERGLHAPARTTAELLAEALRLDATDRAALLGALPARRLSVPPTPPEAPPLPLVGRTAEMRQIERVLTGEGPPLLVVQGEPGIGKTRLLREALAHATGQGMPVLRGGCHRRSGEEPFEPLLSALLRYLRHTPPARQRLDLRGSNWLVRLLPELAETAPVPLPLWILPAEHERRLMFAAVRQFLANVAGTGRVLLVLDDLHWAGRDALDLLGALLRPAPEPGLRVLAAMRETEVRPGDPLALLLADLEREGLAARVPVGVLSAGESAVLLDHLLAPGTPTRGITSPVEAAVRQRILERSDGVPLYLVSCADGWRAAREDPTGPGAAVDARGVPLTLAQSIRLRVLALPEGARQVLEVAAVVGRVAQHALLVAALEPLGSTMADVVAALEAATAAGLLVEDGPVAHAFAHDLIREALVAEMSAARRHAVHRRIALVLEDASGAAAVEALAYHFTGAAHHAKSLIYLEQAGEHARTVSAFARAAWYFREWVDLLERLGRSREVAPACERLGEALRIQGRYDEALDALERAARIYQEAGDRDGLARVTARLGNLHANRGTPEAGVARIRALLDLPGEADVPSAGQVTLYLALARLEVVRGRYLATLASAERAVTLALAMGDQQLWAQAEKERGTALLMLGHNQEGTAALEALLPVLETVGDMNLRARTHNNLSVVYEEDGAFAQARAHIDQAIAAAEHSGDPILLSFMVYRRGSNALLHGDWTLAQGYLEHTVALARELGPSWAAPYPPIGLGRLHLMRGERERALALISEGLALAEHSGDMQAQQMALNALAESDLIDGHPERAWERLAPWASLEQESDVSLLRANQVWALARLDRQADATALLRRALVVARRERGSLAVVELLRVRAQMEVWEGRYRAAQATSRTALRLIQRLGTPYAEAKVLAMRGRASRNRARARAYFTAALAILNRLGERPVALRCERALAALHAVGAP